MPGTATYGNGRYVIGGFGGLYTTQARCGALLDIAADDRACGPITRLVQKQVIHGYPDGMYHPEESVTRAQLAKRHWSRAPVGAGYTAGLIGPNAKTPLWTDAAFDPDKPATRAEAAVLLDNLTAGRP